MTYELLERAYHYRRYTECLAGIGKTLRQETTIDYVVHHGHLSGETSEDIKRDLIRHNMSSTEIDAALQNPLAFAPILADAEEHDFVRTAIASDGTQHSIEDLTSRSPVEIPGNIRSQRRIFGNIAYLDWRWNNPTENPATISAALNQRTDDGLWTAHLRFASVSFPLLSFQTQVALWLGLLESKRFNVRIILLLTFNRFHRAYLTGILRLAERDCRISGKQHPGQLICEDPLARNDFLFYFRQVSDMRRVLCSNANCRYCCHPAGLDPLSTILLPGNDGNRTTCALIWAAEPDFDNDMIF